MSEIKKRSYKSAARDTQAAQTKARILDSAKKLFESEGFEHVTIEKIAQGGRRFNSHHLFALSVQTRCASGFNGRGSSHRSIQCPCRKEYTREITKKRLRISAKIARQMYDAERAQMNIFRGAAVLAPEFKELEKEREMRRYNRQEVTIKAMVKEKSLAKGLRATKARDILWAFTGRDMYRMFVIEQGWTSDEYEKWLAQTLIQTLIEDGR